MSELVTGLVLAHLGQGIAVEYQNRVILCQTLRKLETVVVGDKVLLRLIGENQGRIEQLLARDSVLLRPARGGKARPVVANLNTVFVVFAVEPVCDFLLIDQYLAVCEHYQLQAGLIFNKCDLPSHDLIEQELAYYQHLDYSLYRVSVKENRGLTDLTEVLSQQVSLFAGQSGVGKSSLTRALIPDKEIKVNSISALSKHGRHTTTAATLYHLPQGGDLIDSPGVAIFGLADLTEMQLAQGFREFQPFIGQCQFNDCRHQQDKGCAVRNAVEQGLISQNRYQRFLKLCTKR